MQPLRPYFIIILLAFLSACSMVPYKAAEKNAEHDYTPGYLDEEISPGVYIVEVQGGKSRPLVNKEQELLRMQEHWNKRSKELCQHGYRGESEIIAASQARIEKFRCETESCKNIPLVSGVIWCHQRYYL